MCEPISLGIAAMGLAAATTAVSVVGQIQSANAYNKSIAKQATAKNKEIDQASTAEINERLRQARREQGRIMVAAGESGINTGSPLVDGLLTDAAMQATLANQTSLANRESRRASTTAEANAMMKSKPTVLGAGLQIGLSAAQAGMSAGAFGKGKG